MDREAIIKSVKKTHRCVAVEEGWSQSGITAEILAIIMESNKININLYNLLFRWGFWLFRRSSS